MAETADLVGRPRRGGLTFEKVGSYDTGFNENDENKKAWRIPNVIGVVRKKR